MNDVSSLARSVIATGFDDERDPGAHGFAGYVLFARNGTSVAQVRAVTDRLRAHYAAGPPPLIAIDQEGGRVVRLSEGLEPMPSMMALGAVGDTELAARAGEQTAFDVRRAGCTMDFAPVLDLALDPCNTVIGTRALGSDPNAVASLAKAYASGMARGGIQSCLKHFPGHGSTATDSHLALPVVEVDAVTLRARDVVPFARLVHDAPAIMGAHVLVPAFDPDRPATLSSRIIVDLLRGELGFTGVFVTDALEMGGIENGAVEGAVGALSAGADLLLVSGGIESALEIADAIERALQNGTVSRRRLEEASARVAHLRASSAPPLPVEAFPPHPGVGREIARCAVTVVRGLPHADPVASHAVQFLPLQAEGAEERLRDAGLRREAPALEETYLRLDPSEEEVRALHRALERSGRRPIVISRRAHLHPAQAAAIATVVEGYPDAVVVSALEPFDLPLFSGARHLFACYGDDLASMGGLADVLFGGSLPKGRLPVPLAVEA